MTYLHRLPMLLQASLFFGLGVSALTGCARTDDSFARKSLTSATQAQTKPSTTTNPDAPNTDPGNGGSGDPGASPTPGTQSGDLTVGGKITFDFVPATTNGLNFTATSEHPVRGALVEAVRSSDNTVISSAVTDSDGNYQLPVAAQTMIVIRVRARLLHSGTPSWDFRVVDNTRSQAMYVMDSASFNTGVINIPDKSLHAASGWGGSHYTSARMAAPFAILDVMYQNLQAVLGVDNTLIFPMLQINWSASNVPSVGTLSLGQITTTHYNSADGQLYVLGAQNVDTDEYDTHVIAHEWAHYLENRFSRTDSLGGGHTLSASLDPRVAFSEGLANAFSGVSTQDPIYNDTSGAQQALTQISFNLESRPAGASSGPYSETSVQTVLYNYFLDQGTSAIPSFNPIFTALRGAHKATNAFTTIYSFIDAIRLSAPATLPRLNALLSTENISTGTHDAFDGTHAETNFAGLTGVAYLYLKLNLGDAPKRVCSRGELGNFNRAFNRRYFYFDVPNSITSRTYTIRAVPSTTGDAGIVLFRQGVKLKARDSVGTGQTETLQANLGPGTYVGEVYDSKIVNQSASSYECLDISLE